MDPMPGRNSENNDTDTDDAGSKAAAEEAADTADTAPGSPVCENLWRLYLRFAHSPLVQYHESLPLPLAGGSSGGPVHAEWDAGEGPFPACAITINRTYEPRESLVIAQPLDFAQTWVFWEGDDAVAMAATVEALRLPHSWPQNLGQKAFYVFRSQLRAGLLPPGPLSLSLRLINGKEHHFRVLIAPLLELFNRGDCWKPST